MVDFFAGSGATAAEASAAQGGEDRKQAADLPPGLDPAEYPILSLHWFGLDLAHEAPETEEAA